MPKTPRPRASAIRKARHEARDARAAAGGDPVTTKAAATAVARAAKSRKQARKRRARSAELTERSEQVGEVYESGFLQNG
ncbi:MAG: hypothetical protein NT062_17275 [Proteobacteria bacterium]|nr:hypothetical protein [Pseudomonadota bacterium]